jgi:hypothetical protein
MISECPDFTAEQVRKWMGDFSGETIVGKYASRMGLCFSTTRAVGEVNLLLENDIKHNGRFVFCMNVFSRRALIFRLVLLQMGLVV